MYPGLEAKIKVFLHLIATDSGSDSDSLVASRSESVQTAPGKQASQKSAGTKFGPMEGVYV